MAVAAALFIRRKKKCILGWCQREGAIINLRGRHLEWFSAYFPLSISRPKHHICTRVTVAGQPPVRKFELCNSIVCIYKRTTFTSNACSEAWDNNDNPCATARASLFFIFIPAFFDMYNWLYQFFFFVAKMTKFWMDSEEKMKPIEREREIDMNSSTS